MHSQALVFAPCGLVIVCDGQQDIIRVGSAVDVVRIGAAAADSYNVVLTVKDDDDATGTEYQSVTVHDVSPSTMHVGDLEGTSVNVKKNWQAQVSIAVHDSDEELVAGAKVDGSWSGDAS